MRLATCFLWRISCVKRLTSVQCPTNFTTNGALGQVCQFAFVQFQSNAAFRNGHHFLHYQVILGAQND